MRSMTVHLTMKVCQWLAGKERYMLDSAEHLPVRSSFLRPKQLNIAAASKWLLTCSLKDISGLLQTTNL